MYSDIPLHMNWFNFYHFYIISRVHSLIKDLKMLTTKATMAVINKELPKRKLSTQ